MAWNDLHRLRERFSFVCSAQLDDMSSTDKDRVYHCAKCDTSVYEAASATEFDHHARQGRCVSVETRCGVTIVAQPDDPDQGGRRPVPAMVGHAADAASAAACPKAVCTFAALRLAR